ncbi:MAG: response regulator transcription factor [Symbiopectobacterium sp.]|uniref:response regulator transcription factor n=1 Tax=Symbiopectobacterium sp. TaxID=2952789 RepID=UPI003F375E94
MERTVVLLHFDHYFTVGLGHLIHQWFHTQKLEVNIQHTTVQLEQADIIFTTATQHAPRWWRQFRRKRRATLLFLLVKQKNTLCCGYEDGQLALGDPPGSLSALLNTFIVSPSSSGIPSHVHRYNIMQCLSPREREVLWGYKQGLNNSKISELYGISIKAISAYRNHAMQKLMLKNHADLHEWLHSIAAENLSCYFKQKRQRTHSARSM